MHEVVSIPRESLLDILCLPRAIHRLTELRVRNFLTGHYGRKFLTTLTGKAMSLCGIFNSRNSGDVYTKVGLLEKIAHLSKKNNIFTVF